MQWWRRWRRSGCRVGAGDRGSSVVEAVVILPIVVILTLLVVQMAMIWHGRHLAQAAAQAGVSAASGYRSSTAAGWQATTDYLQQVAPRLLANPDVGVTGGRTGGTVTVTVTVRAHVATILPFVSFSVDESATGPVESFVPPPGG